MRTIQKSRLAIILILAATLILIAGYFSMVIYYQDGFSCGTWINGIYCTGKTAEEVNDELVEITVLPNIEITDKMGIIYTIPSENLMAELSYQDSLNAYLASQNSFLWIDNLTLHRKHTIAPSINFDKDILIDAIQDNPIWTELIALQDSDVYLYKSENGYELHDGTIDYIDGNKVLSYVVDLLKKGIFTMDLTASDCYVKLSYSKEDEQTLALYEKIKSFTTSEIKYDMGDEVRSLSPAVLSNWITLTEDGNIYLNDEGELVLREGAIEEYIADLAAQYDTYKITREFTATSGKVVNVKGVTYGTQIDQEKEVKWLTEAFLSHSEEVHIPAYLKEGFVRGKDDIGDTYIEIDMGDQKLYYYQNGEMAFETDIVTGNTSRKMGTPEGINYVYNKQKNRTLVGPNYRSFVKFWMPVKGAIGIHDASWRDEFGGEIYKKAGSHGCINIPPEIMEELYDMVEIGTPVIMFY